MTRTNRFSNENDWGFFIDLENEKNKYEIPNYNEYVDSGTKPMVMSHLNNLYTIQEDKDNEDHIFDAEHNLKSSYYDCDYDYKYACEYVYKYKGTKNESPPPQPQPQEVEKLVLVKPAFLERSKNKDKKVIFNRVLYFTITICFSSYVLFCHNINT